MPVNSTHPEYDGALMAWLRARDVLEGEDAVKRGGTRYLPQLSAQSEEEYRAYVQRGFFFNATARTAAGCVGLIFRHKPILTLPPEAGVMGAVIERLANDVDLRGTTLDAYARHTVSEVICLGRCGTLVDWQDEENRAYLHHYPAECILNWRETRLHGRLQLSLLVLAETVFAEPTTADPFAGEEVEQLRVLRLVDRNSESADGNSAVKLEQQEPSAPFNGVAAVGADRSQPSYMVEVWQRRATGRSRNKEWTLVRRSTPRRRGRPLTAIPFVFHGPTHSRAAVAKPPIADLVAANLDHYRVTAEYRHGMHFTALPTAWVSGFDREAELCIGSTTAWTTETVGASAGFLEFKGEGLGTFEKALDRCERTMTVLGSRLLETQKRVSESAEALALRQAGESSIIGSLAGAVTASLNEALRWVYWWHSTAGVPEAVTPQQVRYELNTDFEAARLGAKELTALVAAWQQGAISRDTLLHNLRSGELLPPARTNEQEVQLIGQEPAPAKVLTMEGRPVDDGRS